MVEGCVCLRHCRHLKDLDSFEGGNALSLPESNPSQEGEFELKIKM